MRRRPTQEGGPGIERRSVAIASLACAVLLYEIGITRILSVTVGYHFAFLSISLAMLGLGAPGVWFALRPPGPRLLPALMTAAGAVLPLSIATFFAIGPRLPGIQDRVPELTGVLQPGVLVAVACVLPTMLCLGAAICALLVLARSDEIPRLYGSDLLGAAAGAVLVIPLMRVVPTPSLLALAGLLPLAGLAVLVRPVPRRAWALGAAIVALVAWGAPFRLTWTKNYVEHDVLFERWTPTARITVFPNPFWRTDPGQSFGWGMGSRWTGEQRPPLWIEQDGSAGTPILRIGPGRPSLPHLFYDVTSLGYQIRPPSRALVIGAGGGRDVVTALQAGAREVVAVELNPAIVEAIEGPFREESGNIYGRDEVRVHVSEGRSFLMRTDERFDSIQISLIDSWAATSAGAYALSENYLYTVEALRLYLSRLTESGWISISRWGTGLPKMEIARLSLMAERALKAAGVHEPRSHLVIVQGGKVATLLASLSPWTPEELMRVRTVGEERGFVPHWPPGPDTPRDSIVALMLTAGPESVEEFGFDLSPSGDDRPFFFQTLRVFGSVDPRILPSLSGNEHAVLLLRRLLVLVGALAAALFFLPFALSNTLPRGDGFWAGSLFFACIGAGYMLVQAPWVQRFVLYLGHPAYATTVVLGAMLVGTGAGALASGRMAANLSRRGLLALPAVLLAWNLLLGPLFGATADMGLGARMAMATLVVAPAGFLMGLAFPTGVARFGQRRLAWFWAMNGFAGVTAAVASVALSMAFGLKATAWFACVFYLLAAFLVAIPDAANQRQASSHGAHS